MGVSVAVHFSWREDTQATELVGVLYFWFTQNSALASGLQTCKMQLSPFEVAALLTTYRKLQNPGLQSDLP